MLPIAITGATGFVGSELLRTILLNSQRPVIVITRAKSGQSAEERVARLRSWWEKFGIDPGGWERVRVVDADLEHCAPIDLGPIEVFYHCAAATDFDLPLKVARNRNVTGTLNALAMARRSEKLKRFVHFSTAFVAGNRRGLISEQTRPGRARNTYEQTKLESELSVSKSGLPFTIIRPSIIVGRSADGYFLGTKVIFSVLRLWFTGILPRAPLNPNSRTDIVPIDEVVNFALAAADAACTLRETVQVTAGMNGVTNRSIIDAAKVTFAMPEPLWFPVWIAKLMTNDRILPMVPHAIANALRLMRHHFPYLGLGSRKFDNSKYRDICRKLGIKPQSFASYGTKMFEFCAKTSWGKKPAQLQSA